MAGTGVDTLIAFVARYFYLVVLVLALAVLALHYWPRRSRLDELVDLALAVVFIGAVAFLLAQIGHAVVSSPRPFVQTGQPALIPSSADNGFPSDHTLLLGMAAAVITVVVGWQIGLVFWAAALLVGLARVYAGVHHPIDIVGSLVFAIIALALYLPVRQLWRRWREERVHTG